MNYLYILGFPGVSDSKESACNAGEPGLIPGSGRSLGEGNGNPLQYSCLENPLEKKMATQSSIRTWRIPWRRKWQPTPVFVPGESHGQRSLAGYNPWGHKNLDTDWVTNTHLSNILNIKLLLDTSSCQYFLLFYKSSFHFFGGVLCYAKTCKLIIILFFLLPWKNYLRKYCYDLYQVMFCLCSLLRVFMVSYFIFTSSNHFKFTFVFGVRVYSNFIDLHLAVQLSQYHLLKRLSFLYCIFFCPLLKIN